MSVKCLGETFDSHDERREHFRQLLREHLVEMREFDGFPDGEIDDIIRLSDPPFFTPCPNPFLRDVNTEDEDDDYHRLPYALPIKEKKNHPIYNAHTYHTKVPHRAIMKYILHFTKPGDVVLDGFSGSGMTGVAGQLCDNRQEVTDIGYEVNSEGEVIGSKGDVFSKLGARKVILNDLSPAASFIAYNYNIDCSQKEFVDEANKIIHWFQETFGWMYETPIQSGQNRQSGLSDWGLGFEQVKLARVNYTVWSDIITCDECEENLLFWDVAVNQVTHYKLNEYTCTNCSHVGNTKSIEEVMGTHTDHAGDKVQQTLEEPVILEYRPQGASFLSVKLQRSLLPVDHTVLNRINDEEIECWFPTDIIQNGYNTKQPLASHGISRIHHFYTKRNLRAYSVLWERANQIQDSRLANMVRFWLQSISVGMTKMNRYFKESYSQVNRYLKGTLYVAPVRSETNPLYCLEGKVEAMECLDFRGHDVFVSTGSTTQLPLDDNSIDYIFTDPPFGSNINYSELDVIWESWLKVKTSVEEEAIVNEEQEKGLEEYGSLLLSCFQEYHRVLKPNRWMTVEFNNSDDSVWKELQSALVESGFIIADIQALDKVQQSMKQMTSKNIPKQDLVISVYKSEIPLTNVSPIQSDSIEDVWQFVDRHLNHLPISSAERDSSALYNTLTSHHLLNNQLPIYDIEEFNNQLSERFTVVNELFYTKEQLISVNRQQKLKLD